MSCGCAQSVWTTGLDSSRMLHHIVDYNGGLQVPWGSTHRLMVLSWLTGGCESFLSH